MTLTLRTLYTNAANLVAIDRYRCVRVLQARLVSVISTDDSRHPLLFAALPLLRLAPPIIIGTLLLKFFFKIQCSFM